MSFDPLSAAFELGKTAIERFFPDPLKRAEEMRKLEELNQKGDIAELNAHVQLMLGQMDINKTEAAHKSIFVAGWRPFIGWVCGFALVYQFILYGLLVWGWSILQAMEIIPMQICSIQDAKEICVAISPPPVLETGALLTLLLGMLGIGAQRSFDKKSGTETMSVGK